ncbi:cupin domain-containing protein [Polyangium spumosum]|uniref:Cupin domain-containing protein n=1 Tax=Polyangium spumosum TaxID=889282 RepID=A0A6N7Q1I1_9BACT|nr:cupin domain-containing protein [Polyangium spumosum]MRG98143.1 cupin domain-containing protein [Polyangium spumosum]
MLAGIVPMKRPSYIVNQSESPRRTAKIISTGEPLAAVADLSGPAGLCQLRIQHEILPPGHRSSSPHAHTHREEFVYVLEGEPDAWIDGELYPLRRGDTIALCAGTGIAHSIINNSKREVHILAIASSPEQDGCYFPLSGIRDNVPDEIAIAWAGRLRGAHDGRARAVDPAEADVDSSPIEHE